MSQYVTYKIALISSNMALIAMINNELKDSVDGTTASKTSTAADKPKAKAATAKTTKAKTTKAADDDAIDMAAMKDIIRTAKKDHGEDFAMASLKTAGGKGDTLSRRLASVAEDSYSDLAIVLKAGPVKATKEVDEFDEFDDDGLGEAEVSAESVVKALRAYSASVGRDEARTIMNDNGAAALSDVEDCSPKELASMMKALV